MRPQSPPLHSSGSEQRTGILWWLVAPLLAIPLLLGLLAFGVVGCFRLSRDSAVLRDSLLPSASVHWDKQIELNVGAVTVGLVRTGLRWVHLDPDVRAALPALRGVEVGVYRLRDSTPQPAHATRLSLADEAMARRGWDRLVAVVEGGKCVAAYVPRGLRSPKRVSFCLAVLDGHELVVVAARSNLEPLLPLVMAKTYGEAVVPGGWRAQSRARF